jgi:hypothetical protein
MSTGAEQPVLHLVLTAAQLRLLFPSWKILYSPSNGKATAYRKTIKGRLRIKGTLRGVAQSMHSITKREFEGVR